MGKDDFIKIDKNDLPDDLSYGGVSGDDYYLSFAHYWSKSKNKTFFNSYLGDWYIQKRNGE